MRKLDLVIGCCRECPYFDDTYSEIEDGWCLLCGDIVEDSGVISDVCGLEEA